MDRQFARTYGLMKREIQTAKGTYCKNFSAHLKRFAKRSTKRARRRLETQVLRETY